MPDRTFPRRAERLDVKALERFVEQHTIETID
jgi:hypothetical protein